MPENYTFQHTKCTKFGAHRTHCVAERKRANRNTNQKWLFHVFYVLNEKLMARIFTVYSWVPGSRASVSARDNQMTNLCFCVCIISTLSYNFTAQSCVTMECIINHIWIFGPCVFRCGGRRWWWSIHSPWKCVVNNNVCLHCPKTLWQFVSLLFISINISILDRGAKSAALFSVTIHVFTQFRKMHAHNAYGLMTGTHRTARTVNFIFLSTHADMRAPRWASVCALCRTNTIIY